MKKRISILLAGLAIVSGSAFAGSLSLTNEVKMNDEEGYRSDGRTKYEWTIANGNYKFDNGLRFLFDIDRDFYKYESDTEEHEGWDTGFGLFTPVPKFEMLGKTFQNEVGVEYYFDQESDYDNKDQAEEHEIGLAWKTVTKLDEITTFSSKMWGRYIDYEQGTKDETHFVVGIENDIKMKFNKNWSASMALDMFQGGYEQLSQSTQFDGTDSVHGFNYEYFASLDYTADLYKTDTLTVYFANQFGLDAYRQGDNYKDREKDIQRTFVMPKLGFKAKATDDLSFHGWAGYRLLGKYDTGSTSGDYNELEAVLGVKYTM
jgi:hypothetical protein